MFAVNRVNLIAAGSETRFPGRKQHVTTPDQQGSPPPKPRGLRSVLPPGAWPHTEVPSWTLSRSPFSRDRNEGGWSPNGPGVEEERGSGGIHTGVVPIQAGDLSVKSVLPAPFSFLGQFLPRMGEGGVGWRRGFLSQTREGLGALTREVRRVSLRRLSRGCTSFCPPRVPLLSWSL